MLLSVAFCCLVLPTHVAQWRLVLLMLVINATNKARLPPPPPPHHHSSSLTNIIPLHRQNTLPNGPQLDFAFGRDDLKTTPSLCPELSCLGDLMLEKLLGVSLAFRCKTISVILAFMLGGIPSTRFLVTLMTFSRSFAASQFMLSK